MAVSWRVSIAFMAGPGSRGIRDQGVKWALPAAKLLILYPGRVSLEAHVRVGSSRRGITVLRGEKVFKGVAVWWIRSRGIRDGDQGAE